MIILGLTGSIAMGKTTAALMFRRHGVRVFDADATVHGLLGEDGEAVPLVAAAFGGVVTGRQVDRPALARRVFNDHAALVRLEQILHPLVAQRQRHFLRSSALRGADLVVLDIPLLFETGGERDCDAVAVVSAPRFVQIERLMARPNMDRRRVEATLARQMPDAEKRRRADYVIQTGRGKAETVRAVGEIVADCKRRKPAKWPPKRMTLSVG